jgi:hypothetical protein
MTNGKVVLAGCLLLFVASPMAHAYDYEFRAKCTFSMHAKKKPEVIPCSARSSSGQGALGMTITPKHSFKPFLIEGVVATDTTKPSWMLDGKWMIQEVGDPKAYPTCWIIKDFQFCIKNAEPKYKDGSYKSNCSYSPSENRTPIHAWCNINVKTDDESGDMYVISAVLPNGKEYEISGEVDQPFARLNGQEATQEASTPGSSEICVTNTKTHFTLCVVPGQASVN